VQFVPSDLFGGVLILPEIPPTEEDKKDKKRPLGLFTPFTDIFSAIKTCQRCGS
jgi:hypothetical protein